MTSPPRPPFVGDDLAPAAIRAARAELVAGAWRAHALALVVGLELVFGGLVVGPLLILLMLATGFEGALLTIATVATGLVALGWATRTQRAWLRRKEQLTTGTGPYDRPILDPRWQDAQTLLFALRGSDPDSAQAEEVYGLALVLSEAFVRRDEIAAATSAARALGDDGTESLAALLARHDEPLNRALVDLKRACAVSLTDTTDAASITSDLSKDLHLRLEARLEVEQVEGNGADRARPIPRRALES